LDWDETNELINLLYKIDVPFAVVIMALESGGDAFRRAFSSTEAVSCRHFVSATTDVVVVFGGGAGGGRITSRCTLLIPIRAECTSLRVDRRGPLMRQFYVFSVVIKRRRRHKTKINYR
jgi:hypothetical protein